MKFKEKNKFGNLIRQRSALFFAKVGALPPMHRILICVLTFVGVMGVFYYFFYMPRHETLKRLGFEHVQLKGNWMFIKAKQHF